MYSIRDAKAEIFHVPFFKKSHGEAERDFKTTVNDGKTQLHQYPEDFDLYYIGVYDDNKGVTKSLDTPQHVVKAVNCLNENKISPLKSPK